jgi:hypothetical protein
MVHLEIFSDEFKELIKQIQLHSEVMGKGVFSPRMPFNIVGPHP